MLRLRRHAVLVTAVVLALVLPPGLARADPGDVGWQGPSWSGAFTEPVGSKPQSKLWWNDGRWWASLFNTVTADFHIFRLETATQTWVDTGVALDNRARSRADTLWDGTHLYVASHFFDTTPEPGSGARLYRYSYDDVTDTYTRDPGFPVDINAVRTETLVMDKDSTGTLWATWTQDNLVYVNRTMGDDRTWGIPFVPAVSGTSVAADDISSIVAFGGNQIGLMWSNQSASAMYFAVHVDGQPDTAWEASRTAIQGPNNADDHINLKSIQSDGSGRVYAAVKTSQTTSSAPLILLLVRDPATGDWASHVFGRVSDHHTRPIVMLDEEHGVIHMFATGPSAAVPTGTVAIYEKTSPIDNISFPPGYGTPVIMDADVPDMDNVTSTKQGVNATTGLVVLAGSETSKRYWHNYLPLGPVPAPTADFTAWPVSGTAPLTVAFTDTSSGAPTSWNWSFGDGTTSTQQHPAHTYGEPGSYNVSLTVTNGAGSDTETKVDLVTVTPPPPTAAFTASPTTGALPLTVSFGDTSTWGPTSWEWSFGDGATSNLQHPTHTYTTAGVYSVTLTVANAQGTDTEIKSNLITAGTQATFTPTADSYVMSNKTTTNFGRAKNLRVRSSGPTVRSYLQFDVSGVSGPVLSARLRLRVANTSPDGGRVYSVADNNWAETGITWANAPALGSPIASVGPVPTAGTWVDIDVSSAIGGNGTWTLALADGVTDLAYYNSRETANDPQLVVVSSG